MLVNIILLTLSALAIHLSLRFLSSKDANIPKTIVFLAAQFTFVNLINAYIFHRHPLVGILIQFACAAVLIHVIFSADAKVSALVAGIYLLVKSVAIQAVSYIRHHLF